MKAEINIEEVKANAVHSELLKAMCLINQARNIVSGAMDEKELRDVGQWDCLDETVTKLNECTWLYHWCHSHWQSRINDEITRLSKGSLRTTLMAAFNSLLKSNDYGRNLERY